MANRLFLTLLALLTGLATQIGPAQARVSDAGEARVRAELCIRVSQRGSASVALVRAPSSVLHAGVIARCGRSLPVAGWRAHSVRPGIDRARE